MACLMMRMMTNQQIWGTGHTLFSDKTPYIIHMHLYYSIYTYVFLTKYIFCIARGSTCICPRKLLIMFLETHVFAPESQDFTHNSSDFELCCDLAGWHHPQNDERFRFCPGRQVSDSLLEFGVGK